MLVVERVVALAATPLFSSVSHHALARLAPHASEVLLSPGEEMISAGAIEQWLFVVVDGEVEVDTAGGPVILGPGSVVGEFAALNPGPRAARVTAATPVVALRLDHDDLMRTMEDTPALGSALAVTLAQRCQDLRGELAARPPA